MSAKAATVTMCRPLGPEEYALVRDSGFRRWPPRLPEQPIFYPVTNRRYAEEITSRWNVKDSGVGYVAQFDVLAAFVEQYAIQKSAAHITPSGGFRPKTWTTSTRRSSASSRSLPVSMLRLPSPAHDPVLRAVFRRCRRCRADRAVDLLAADPGAPARPSSGCVGQLRRPGLHQPHSVALVVGAPLPQLPRRCTVRSGHTRLAIAADHFFGLGMAALLGLLSKVLA